MSVETRQFIASHVVDLPRSGIRDFFEIVSQKKEVISLSVGEPDFITPWHVREAAIYALEKGRTSYTGNRGLPKVCQAISRYVEKEFSLSYHPEKEILVTVGVSEALDIALRALVNPGDKVMFHEPCYVSYHPSIRLTHGVPVGVPTRAEDQFALDPEALARAWTPGCKVLLLNFPTNPTGGVMDRERLETLARWAVEKDLVVIADEIYSELTFEGERVSIATMPGMKERTIFLHGVSKAFAMTGFRLGWACGPAELIEAMMKIHQYSMLCAPILCQEAAAEALIHGSESVQKMKEQYQRRRDFIVRRFNEMGLRCHSPMGSFYAFPSVADTGMAEKAFALGLLEEKNVAVVPGTAFGAAGEGFVRACFATAYDQLVEACDRMEAFIEERRSDAG